jgi:response regulator RpfG family c-di-GMP phosphodiesterase
MRYHRPSRLWDNNSCEYPDLNGGIIRVIKIVIADDHPIVRAGLKQVLADASDIEVAAEASNGHELLKLVREGGIDAVLLDIT